MSTFERDEDGEPYTAERLAAWLDAKYSRHKEYEDKAAANFIRQANAALTRRAEEQGALAVLQEYAALEELERQAAAIAFAGPASPFGEKWGDEHHRLRKEYVRRRRLADDARCAALAGLPKSPPALAVEPFDRSLIDKIIEGERELDGNDSQTLCFLMAEHWKRVAMDYKARANDYDRIKTELKIARAHPPAAEPREPCSICNALIVQRNPTHYDQQDLDAADARAKILHSRVNFDPPEPIVGEPAWQPIETAPKDESTVLLAVRTRYRKWNWWLPLAGRRIGAHWCVLNADEAVQRVEPSHWMPFPPLLLNPRQASEGAMTMTDAELLEAAAKAAGYELWWGVTDPMIRCDEPEHPEKTHNLWNPLTDDGDALRLAVKLGIDIRLFGSVGWRANDQPHWCGSLVDSLGKAFSELALPDPYAATRRAIVRAAAALGEMK